MTCDATPFQARGVAYTALTWRRAPKKRNFEAETPEAEQLCLSDSQGCLRISNLMRLAASHEICHCPVRVSV